jgi:hypothetical protein
MSENLTALTDAEWEELCSFGEMTCRGVALTLSQATRADNLGKRIRIQRPPPIPPPPGTLPPTIKIPRMWPADTIAGDPGVGGPIA